MRTNNNPEIRSGLVMVASRPSEPGVKSKSESSSGMLIAWLLLIIGIIFIVIRLVSGKKKDQIVSIGDAQNCKEKINNYFNEYYLYYKHRHVIDYNLMYSLKIEANKKSEEFNRILSLQDLGISYNDSFDTGYKFLAFLADSQEVSAWRRSLEMIYRTIEAIAESDIIRLVQENYNTKINQEYLVRVESRKQELMQEIDKHPRIVSILSNRLCAN